MVLPVVAGLLLAGGGTYLLAGIVSHLISPLSLLAALVFGVGSFIWLEQNRVLSVISNPDARLIANAGVAAVIGLVVFKSIAWVLAGASVVVIVVIGLVLLIGGPALLWSLLRGGASVLFG